MVTKIMNTKAAIELEDEFAESRFEGVCPTCEQPFLMEYVKDLEKTIVITKQAIESLHALNNKQAAEIVLLQGFKKTEQGIIIKH